MHAHHPSVSTSPSRKIEAWKTVVQPYVASTHLPTYKIIGAAPRPRCPEDDVPVKPVLRRNKPSSSSSTSSTSRRGRDGAKRTTPVTRENLSRISMACAREEDLDAPFPSPSAPLERRRTSSETSISSIGSSMPSITEEEE